MCSASSGRTCAVMIIKPAVSSGSALPTGLNGSCKLSAPAAMVTPAERNARTAVTARGMATWKSTLQEQVGVGQGDHPDAGLGHLLGDLALTLLTLQRQRHAMA